MDAYTELIKSIDFKEVLLKDLHVSRFPEPETGNLNADINFEPDLVHFGEGHLIASMSYAISANSEGNEIFSIMFELIASYSYAEDSMASDHEAQQFVRNNVPVNVWPFARELIYNMTNRMNVPGLMIPSLRQMPAADESDEE